MKPADAAMFAAADQRLIDVTRESPRVLQALLVHRHRSTQIDLRADGPADTASRIAAREAST